MALSNPFKKILDGLRIEPHDYQISTELLGQISPDKISKELDLEKVGKSRGENDLPKTSSVALDDMETKINERIGQAKKEASDIVENEFFTYSSRISMLDFEGKFHEIKQSGPIAASELKSEIERGLGDMQIARRPLLRMEKEYKKFRAENQLDYRTAKIPNNLKLTVFYLVIVLIFLFETLSNGIFLGETSERGILGGIFQAFYFTFVNIASSFLLTYFGVRQLFHVNPGRKFFGFISLIALICVALIINLALAHVRELASAAEITLDGSSLNWTNDVVKNIINNPLGIADIKSWLLFGLGLCFSGLVMADFLYFNDVYPGYATVQRKLDYELENYQEEFNAALDELTDMKEDFHDTLTTLNSTLSTRFQELDQILANKERLTNIYLSHHEQLQRASDTLFSIYYAANDSTRKSKSPKRFDNKLPVVSNIKLSNQVLNAQEIKKLGKKIAVIKEYLDKQLKEIHDIYEDGMKKYKNLDDVNEAERDE